MQKNFEAFFKGFKAMKDVIIKEFSDKVLYMCPGGNEC